MPTTSPTAPTTPVVDPNAIRIIQFQCPASYAMHDYLVTVWLEVDVKSSRVIKPVVRVLKALCKPSKAGAPICRASGATHGIAYDKCTHISAALQVLRNIKRPDNVDIDEDCMSHTASLQVWHIPPDGESFDPSIPTAKFSLGSAVRTRTKARRIVACLTTTGSRAKLNPIPVGKRHLNHRDTDARKRARVELHASIQRDFARVYKKRADVDRAVKKELKRLVTKLVNGHKKANDGDKHCGPSCECACAWSLSTAEADAVIQRFNACERSHPQSVDSDSPVGISSSDSDEELFADLLGASQLHDGDVCNSGSDSDSEVVFVKTRAAMAAQRYRITDRLTPHPTYPLR